MGTDFELLQLPALGERTDGFKDLASGRAKNLSQRVEVVVPASVSASLLSAEEVAHGGSPDFESGQGGTMVLTGLMLKMESKPMKLW